MPSPSISAPAPSVSRSWLAFGLLAVLAVLAWPVHGTTGFVSEGGEFLPLGVPAADQTSPALAINAEGGYIAWQENGASSGTFTVRARRLNRALTGWYRSFVVNSATEGSHEEPQVVQLADGGAVFVWRGGPLGKQGIFARFLKPGGGNSPVFLGDDIEISPAGSVPNQSPGVARLKDGSVVVTWANFGGDGGRYGVFGQRLTSAGEKLGGKFRLSTTADSNQRSSTVAALADGGFAAAWVSENQRFERSADVFARIFGPAGTPLTGEMRLNQSTNLTATPALAALPEGGFVAAWAEYDYDAPANGWDITVGAFTQQAVATRPTVRLNTYRKSDQLSPKLAVGNGTLMAVWSSKGQDGSREGVFGRSLSPQLELLDEESGLNQTTISQQLTPVIASDPTGRALVAWSSFGSLDSGFDLMARKFIAPAVVARLTCDIAAVAEGVRLTWQTEPGRSYQVQRSSDPVNWDGAEKVDRTAGEATDSAVFPSGSARGFFRIVRLP